MQLFFSTLLFGVIITCIKTNGQLSRNYFADINVLRENSMLRSLKQDYMKDFQLHVTQFNQGMQAMNNLLQDTLVHALINAKKLRVETDGTYVLEVHDTKRTFHVDSGKKNGTRFYKDQEDLEVNGQLYRTERFYDYKTMKLDTKTYKVEKKNNSTSADKASKVKAR